MNVNKAIEKYVTFSYNFKLTNFKKFLFNINYVKIPFLEPIYEFLFHSQLVPGKQQNLLSSFYSKT